MEICFLLYGLDNLDSMKQNSFSGKHFKYTEIEISACCKTMGVDEYGTEPKMEISCYIN